MKIDNCKATRNDVITILGKITTFKGVFNTKEWLYECEFEDGTHQISFEKKSIFEPDLRDIRTLYDMVDWEKYAENIPKCENGAYDLSEHNRYFNFYLKDENGNPVTHHLGIKVVKVDDNKRLSVYLFDDVSYHTSVNDIIHSFDDETKRIFIDIIDDSEGYKICKEDYLYVYDGIHYVNARLRVLCYK